MSEQKRLKIAITGNIGSGKSSFCDIIEQKGYQVLRADDVSKRLLASNKSIKSKIIKTFGEEAYINGEVNKKFLADNVFSDPEKLKKINAILHPGVIYEVEKTGRKVLKESEAYFVEAALIYEAKMYKMFDHVVLITAPVELRESRKTASGMSSEDFQKRDQNQIPEEKKKKHASFVFENNGTLEDLKKKADLLFLLLGLK